MSDRIGRSTRLRRAAVGALLLVLLLSVAAPALAMSTSRMTIDQKTGGISTRFTYQATMDDDGELEHIDFLFPEGFDTEDAHIQLTLLEGLRRITAEYEVEMLESGAVRIAFDPSVPASSNLFIEVYDVVTPIAGGTYEIPVEYGVAVGTRTEVRQDSGLTVKYDTPPRQEVLSRWLDNQDIVESWNSVKFLNIFFKPQHIVVAIPLLFKGWTTSLSLVLLAFPVSIIGGLLVAFMKMAKVPPVRWIASAYINVIRGTPLFLQIFVVFIGFRTVGLRIPDFPSAVAVLSFNSSAYLAEIFRAGIQSISKGQFEAASSLGMNYWQAMQYVIIPQTVKRVLPTMTSEFILLFKDTALLAAVGIFELMMYSQNYVARNANLTAFMVAAAYYLIVTIPLINLVGKLETKLAQSEHGASSPPKGRPKRGVLLGTGGPAPLDAPAPGLGPSVGHGPQKNFDHSAAKHESR
ncbi:MAG: amino acid ABC transporter permease [Coriobacteriia bacterium]|nr:amino acid ABC transporter permease [Coriobacteriia bacterium]